MHIHVTNIVHFRTMQSVPQASPPAPSAKRISSFLACTFTPVTSHPQELRLSPSPLNIFQTTLHHASPATPGTHFPLTCTHVRFSQPQRVTPASEISLLVAHLPNPRPLTFDLGPLTKSVRQQNRARSRPSIHKPREPAGSSPSNSATKSQPRRGPAGFGYVGGGSGVAGTRPQTRINHHPTL
jgi:hypothetical protein